MELAEAGPVCHAEHDTETTGRRATMHKQPFAPMDLDAEPTRENVFRRTHGAHEHGTVRAFIGPTTTEWMQQHQRWWTRTAEKMEGKGTKKIRRRLSKPEAQADSLSELFASKNGPFSAESLASDDSGDSEAQVSDWSSLGDDSDPDECCLDDAMADRPDNAHATPMRPEISINEPSPGPSTIPMPELPESPPPLRTAPVQSQTPRDESTQRARRRSSLSTLKGLFRRHSTNRSASRRDSDAAMYAGRRSLDTIPSVSTSDGWDPGTQSDRGRASSISHVPGALRGAGQLAPPPRSAAESGATSPKLSSLRRLAVTRSSRSNSWQPADSDMPRSEALAAPITPADVNLHLLQMMSKADTSVSRLSRSRRAVAAKVRAYYTRHAQLAETTVLLSTRAAVRREIATHEAFAEQYNEVTCRRYRQSTQPWAEMWLALTKRGIMFYLASRKRPTEAVLFPPHTSVAPRVSLFSTLDLSLALMYYSGEDELRVAVVKFPSAQVACAWYREIGQALLLARVMFPSTVLNEIVPAAQPPPSTVMVNVPELGLRVQVRLGRHTTPVPAGVLTGGVDDALLERQWRCETTTVWHVRHDVVRVLLCDGVVGAKVHDWLAAEQRGELVLGMAWRRFDRLDWIMPCGALDARGDFRVGSVNDAVVSPQLLEGTHALELRVLEHYPDAIAVDTKRVCEPLGVEGFAMLKRETRRRTDMATYRPALLTSHNGFLFFVSAPRAARHMNASAHQCSSLSESDTAVRYYHPDASSCSKQMSLARFMLNITDVEQIEPLLQDPDDESVDSADAASSVDSKGTGVPGQKAGRGRLLGFLRAKKARAAACKFRLVTRTGAAVVLWTASEPCMREWVRRLCELRLYWTHRTMADYALHSQTCMLNYSVQGRNMDTGLEGAWAERLVWHACLILGCRAIIKAGVLFRKRHRHQGLRKVFCVLTQGRLLEFAYPAAPLPPGQTMLAEHMIHNDPTMSQVFRDDTSFTPTSAAASNASLLFTRSRSLALRRCYVVSRLTDDLSTDDIMCEPWVMTDIGNYSGLRLADRVYADGIVSHELITDCIFTVWRPTFVPLILRSKNSELGHAPDDLSDVSEQGSRGESPSPPNQEGTVSFSPPDARFSTETPRSSADDYLSSVSNASSAGHGHDGKPGAYRVGNEIRLSVDDRRDGNKRMGAIGMASSMRRRVGVYRARTSSEMAQWVTAINQEIRRMSLSGEW
ncbi:hypothetical protein IWW54_000927 [Coemansia sp. RSA 2705]|nr:hypothetical protein IWW54_000927 [Coemansia sp. RSA 2705]